MEYNSQKKVFEYLALKMIYSCVHVLFQAYL